MNRRKRLMLQSGGVAVLGCAVGLAIFLVFGSQEAVIFTAVGIPVLLVGAGGVYVWSVYDRSGTSQSEYLEHRARSTADAIRNVWDEFDQLQTRYPEWSPQGIENELKQVLTDAEDQGISFDKRSATYSLGRMASHDVQELERLESAADDLGQQIRESFQSFADEEVSRTNQELSRLTDNDLAEGSEWADPPAELSESPPPSTDQVSEILDDYRTEARAVVDQVANTLESLARRHGTSSPNAMERLQTARDSAAEWAFEEAVDHVLKVRGTIEGELSGVFDRERRELELLLQTVDEKTTNAPVGHEVLERVAELESEINEQESSLELQSLRERRDELRSICIEIVREIDAELDLHLGTLDSSGVPDDFFSRPRVADQNHEQELREIATLDEFRKRWETVTSELLEALEEVRTRASVAETYPKLEGDIDEALRRSGRVTGDDLPLKSATELMRLYSLYHSEVKFNPSVPALTSETESETFAVTARVEIEGEETDEMINVSLTREDQTLSEALRVTETNEVVFDDVPYGEHTVRAEPASSVHNPKEVTLLVDQDTEVDLNIAEASVVERVCGGRSEEVNEHLTEFDSQLQERFQSEGYVHSRMSFPLSDEYLPCLLALWAEREGFAVAVEDGENGAETVYVYDEDAVRSELETVIRYNIDPGDEASFDALRGKFLSAPVPDTTLTELANDVNADGVVLGEGSLKKTEEGQ